MLPIQRYVFISLLGPLSDSPVVMTFMLEIDGGYEVLLTVSAKTSEREGASRHKVLMGNCPIISHTC